MGSCTVQESWEMVNSQKVTIAQMCRLSHKELHINACVIFNSGPSWSTGKWALIIFSVSWKKERKKKNTGGAHLTPVIRHGQNNSHSFSVSLLFLLQTNALNKQTSHFHSLHFKYLKRNSTEIEFGIYNSAKVDISLKFANNFFSVVCEFWVMSSMQCNGIKAIAWDD